MANLKEIRTRIASVTSTRQITSAMKMVSAAKFRKAQDAIVQLRPYANHLHTVLSSLGDALKNDEENAYVKEREQNKVLLVIITSNRGLCGGFNSNVIKRAVKLMNTKYKPQYDKKNIDLFIIGKAGEDFFKKTDLKLLSVNNEIFNEITFENVSVLSNQVIEAYLNGDYDKVEIVYNQFKNAAVQIISNEQFLPIEIDEAENQSSKKTFVDYIFEPTKEELVKQLIPKSLRLAFYKAVLDSNASEHGARMTAMHKATDNATELLKDLKIDYNKARQASITNEILEIVSGANAM